MVTEQVAQSTKILLVDMQQAFMSNGDVKTNRYLLERVYTMKNTLIELKEKGHTIYAAVDSEFDGGKIHPVLADVVDTYLPTWENSMFTPSTQSCNPIYQFELNLEVVKAFGPEDQVLVCGLWRETTLMVVTQLLNYEGISAQLSIDSALSIELRQPITI